MKIHHMNCGTMCPLGGALMDGMTRGLGEAKIVCHCLLVETGDGLVLVDTGLGTADVHNPVPRLSPFFLRTLRLRLSPEETALHQVRALGYSERDVRHIVLTHLDFDHAGGLEDFPEATVHVHAIELEAAREARGFIGRRRYRARQWDNVRWKTYLPAEGERWLGFECVRDLSGLPSDILLVPLAGHTWGHCGVALRDGDRWLLHAGDAYFFRGEMAKSGRHCPPGLRFYQTMMEVDRERRLANQARLRQLRFDHPDVALFSAHDALELDALAREERELMRMAG